MIIGMWALAGCLTGWALWMVFHPPRVVDWVAPTPWLERWMQGLDARLRQGWNPRTRREAEILALPPWHVVGLMLMAWAGGLLLGLDFGKGWLLALGIGILLAWKGPAWVIHRRFLLWQSQLARDFPPLVLMLRIYLDLGEPLAEALGHARPALSRLGQEELDRLLSALQMGARQEALKAWARRTDLPAYGLLADTLAQGWDHGLSGDALTPLDTLIQSSREQGTRSLTARLDGMATIVPLIAAFGELLVVLYAILVGNGIS
ncbi:MAG: hypothetical protein C7B45_17665 [Sulfobacillus acidophilus]|uniref:Type II secretion system protein GspF domain-containing protein n=1 Tax=Sulfobacillus acidophilus TaxID=53633 RepID=A0A2T2WCD9_9FIRM|nr:MAG: hypothetical protein C7B45_17665 [Sulfobacillus acidophilus]